MTVELDLSIHCMITEYLAIIMLQQVNMLSLPLCMPICRICACAQQVLEPLVELADETEYKLEEYMNTFLSSVLHIVGLDVPV